jgi:tetratricopeptide (TPR) repeat protein
VGRNGLRLTYDFSDKSQLEDFQSPAAKAELVDGELDLTPVADGAAFVWALKGAIFEDSLRLNLEVTFPKEPTVELFASVFLDPEDGSGYRFLLNHDEGEAGRSRYVHRIRKEIPRTARQIPKNFDLGGASKPPIESGKKYRWSIVAHQGVLQMSLNGFPLVSKQDATSRKGMLRLVTFGGRLRLDNIRIEGQLNMDWLRKAVSEAETLAARASLEGLHESKQPVDDRDLSVESNTILSAFHPDAVKAYRAGRGLQTSRQYDKAVEQYTKALQIVPAFAAALLRRAQCYAHQGLDDETAKGIEEAIASQPAFFEAIKERGDYHLSCGRYEKAAQDYIKALDLRPDYGEALTSRAYLSFVQGDRAKAIQEIEAAASQLPGDPAIQQAQRRLQRVVQGPPWKKEKTFVKETPHYIVKTDIGEKAAAFYASHAEAIHDLYTSRFGYRVPPKHKAIVYLFETREGYLTYAEMSTQDRPENSLGYYHPYFRELLLFESLDREHTLRVLYHEGFHQFLHRILPRPPYWFNEGVAEFFGASRVESGRVVATGLVQEGRLRDVKMLLGTPLLKRLPDLLKAASRRDFYGGNPSANYAQAWSAIHFLFNGQGGKYASILREYYRVLRDGGTAQAAYETSFGKVDLAAMEREWREYVAKLNPSAQ